MTKVTPKMERIMKETATYGITKNSAQRISVVDGIERIFDAYKLPKNPNRRPLCPVQDSRDSQRARINSRRAMVHYLEPWIKAPATLAWHDYEFLADYCTAKSRKIKGA